ncbi:MAG: glycosyltransferase family 4 protein, partial [Planctomycetes bacterium]|nr:glycosyltransferase family 4 protein [Planctomycetota bacterium]
IGGTETYLRELIAHLPQLADDTEIVLLVPQEVAGVFADSPLRVVSVPHSLRRIAALRFMEAAFANFHATSIERIIADVEPDAILYPQQSMFPKRAPCASVVIIHDLYHLTFPTYCSRLQHWFRNRTYPAAVANADRVIAVSEVTKRSVIEHYGCDPQRIEVVWHGIRQLSPDKITPSDLVSGPYLYYPAVTLPHKNHQLLFRSIARLRDQGRFPYRLVLTGAKSKHWPQLEKEIQSLSLQEIVLHLGYVSYGTVLSLMRGAESLVFPSRCEGFGIPVIEAAMLERKMITSQLDVFAEIGVPDAYRIDFADATALERALHDTTPPRLLREPSTWLDCARETVAVLTQTAREHASMNRLSLPGKMIAASEPQRRSA